MMRIVTPEAVRFATAPRSSLSPADVLTQTLSNALMDVPAWPLRVSAPFVDGVDVVAVCDLFRAAGWALDFYGDERTWSFTFAQP